MPVTASLGGGYDPSVMKQYLQEHAAALTIVEVEEAFETLGSAKVLNLLLLGAASASGALGLQRSSLLAVIEDNVPPKFLDLNKKAFCYFE